MSLVGSTKESLPVNEVKRKVARAAADLVESGMLVGLGTGSTATHMIERLMERQSREGLSFTAVATSLASENQARAGGIPLVDIDTVTTIDLTIDGADEIDHRKRMIKGGGGALLREKLIATASKEMIVIVDENKLVENLGAYGLPVELIPFGYQLTMSHLANLGYQGDLRLNPDGSPFKTDNHNYIIDIHFEKPLENPEKVEEDIRHTVGVVETGFFFEQAGRVYIGYQNGEIEVRA